MIWESVSTLPKVRMGNVYLVCTSHQELHVACYYTNRYSVKPEWYNLIGKPIMYVDYYMLITYPGE